MLVPRRVCAFEAATTLPETNSSHLKMDVWNTKFPFWGPFAFDFPYTHRIHKTGIFTYMKTLNINENM